MSKITRRNFLEVVGTAGALGALAACDTEPPASGGTEQGSSSGSAAEPAAEPEPEPEGPASGHDLSEYPLDPDGSDVEALWEVEEIKADGWFRYTQEGATIGCADDGRVIQVDGLAFKDMNGNGKLDIYEDWRLSPEERVEGLLDLMEIKDMAALRLAPLTQAADPNTDPSLTMGEDEASTLETYIAEQGIRWSDNMGILMNLGSNPMNVVQAINRVEKVSEVNGFGLPFIFEVDPASVLTGCANQMMQAATFDPELVNELWREVARGYRAAGAAMMLGPQIDLHTDPRTVSATVFTEDPKLCADMAQAVISGMQSTYDEDGNDLGWGVDSVACQPKHFVANYSNEGGRSYHGDSGKYVIFPGDAWETQLINFIDGAFNLNSETKQNAAIMTSYSIPWSTDGSLGDRVCAARSPFIVGLARKLGFDGMIATDAIGVQQYDYDGSMADATAVGEAKLMFTNGVDQLLSSEWSLDHAMEAYDQMCDELGEEETDANFRDAARRAALTMFRTTMADNPFLVTTDSVDFLTNTPQFTTGVNDFAQKTVVMLKNDDVISEGWGAGMKVYVPFVEQITINFFGTVTSSWEMPFSEAELRKSFGDIVTDSLDENGLVVRASADAISGCDACIVCITNPDTGGGGSAGAYQPISLQYGEYVANGPNVRTESIAGDLVVTQTVTPYGDVDTYEQENRSYYGASTVATNLSHVETLQEIAAALPNDCPLILCVNSGGPMIFSEVEPYASAILLMFGRALMGGSQMGAFTNPSIDNFIPVVAGEVEPYGLLPMQMPADMDTVEANCEDVPRDCECYEDEMGNVYDFGFGLNWEGVWDDDRTATYCVPPMTVAENQGDVDVYNN